MWVPSRLSIDSNALTTERDKDVVVLRIGGHRVRFGDGRQVSDPGMGIGIHDGKHRTACIGKSSEIVAMVDWIVPDLITAVDLPN